MQQDNAKLIISSQTGENEDEENQRNRKMWVILTEIFMRFDNAYILSRDETANSTRL